MEQRYTLTGNTRAIMAMLAISMLLGSLGTSIANIALPALAVEFSVAFHQVQWVVVSYLAALTVSVLVVGQLGDRFGLKLMHLSGLGLFCFATIWCGLAQHFPMLVAGRVLQGVGGAFLMTLTLALVRVNDGESRMGRAMGLLGTMSALGTALGPSLGGILLSTTGWRSIFFAEVPLALLAFVLALVSLPSAPSDRKFARPGPWVSTTSHLARNLATNLMVAAVMMTTLVVGPFYLGLGLGLNTAMTGLVMSIGPLISIAAGVPSGRAVDASGSKSVLHLGLALLSVGAFLLALLPAIAGVGGYVAAIAVLTPGYQLFQAANNTSVMATVRSDRRGAAAALLTLSRNIGLVIGASAMAALFSAGVGTNNLEVAASASILRGARTIFVLAGLLMVLAIATSWGSAKSR